LAEVPSFGDPTQRSPGARDGVGALLLRSCRLHLASGMLGIALGRSVLAFRILRPVKHKAAADQPVPKVGNRDGPSVSIQRDCDAQDQTQRRTAISKKACTERGTSSYSAKRRRSSSAISTVTSRDQPSAVLKATMRTG
jgi:hypothetical protein